VGSVAILLSVFFFRRWTELVFQQSPTKRFSFSFFGHDSDDLISFPMDPRKTPRHQFPGSLLVPVFFHSRGNLVQLIKLLRRPRLVSEEGLAVSSPEPKPSPWLGEPTKHHYPPPFGCPSSLMIFPPGNAIHPLRQVWSTLVPRFRLCRVVQPLFCPFVSLSEFFMLTGASIFRFPFCEKSTPALL